MNAFLTDVRDTVAPARGSKDGLLPPLLVALTAVTGLVDAFSYLVLGHVFVANMTGNVVFLAFALAGTGGFSALASLVAIACFAAGALAAGRLGGRLPGRERLLGVTAAIQAVLLGAAVIMAGVAADSPVAGATGAHAARRLISVAAMLLGALLGALLVIHVHIVWPLVIALLILVAVTLTSFVRPGNQPGSAA
jgi:uncharacterized membrane protein YoaK (UPF0700 family)